jgi:acetylornithine deacetylase
MCAHIDTVGPSPEYSFDPYRPENCPEDMVQGLGSNDDGASVVSMIAAYRYLCAEGSDIPTISRTQMNIILALTCEEERSGKNGMTGLWPELEPKVDFAIVGEPTGLKAATAERGLLVIDATAHGISGHAARNEGKNALYLALEDIEKLRRHEFRKISPRMGKVNLNVTQINAGTVHNVIPDTCTFVIDIRPTEQYTNEEILKELQDICISELKPRNLSNLSSATFENSPLQKAAESIGIETFSSPTTSDWMRISCDAVKMGPGDSARSHRKDEFVLVSEIEEAINTYIEFINTL